MVMIKAMVCGCFLIGCCGYGFCKLVEYKKRYDEMVYIRYIINVLLMEMENFKGTFGENCLVLSRKIKQPYSDIFKGLYVHLEKERKEAPGIYWERQMEALGKHLYLRKEELNILKEMIRCVEGDTITMPIESLRQTLVEWDKVMKQAERIRTDRSRVTLCLSITVGLILCITIL